MLLLVRHALAVPRSKWSGDDGRRPLTRRGERQAAALVGLLDDLSFDQVLTSPALRCRATVAPLATARGLEAERSRALREGKGGHALDLVLDAGADVVLCTHGDVLLHVLAGLRRYGWPVPPRPRKGKGGVWLLAPDSCTYRPPAA